MINPKGIAAVYARHIVAREAINACRQIAIATGPTPTSDEILRYLEQRDREYAAAFCTAAINFTTQTIEAARADPG